MNNKIKYFLLKFNWNVTVICYHFNIQYNYYISVNAKWSETLFSLKRSDSTFKANGTISMLAELLLYTFMVQLNGWLF